MTNNFSLCKQFKYLSIKYLISNDFWWTEFVEINL